MYKFQKIYAANKSYLQSNSYSLTENIKLRPINHNLTQTKTKILYYPLKCLQNTQTNYLLYGKKKIINVSIYHIHLKKKKKSSRQSKPRVVFISFVFWVNVRLLTLI